MQKEEILIVEDDKNISRLIKFNLEKEGFDAFAVPSGEEALEHLKKYHTDLVILDIMLPGRDGLSILRELRQKKNAVPVLLVTARSGLDERIEGLNLGADDYITKPFYVEELIARLNAVARRGAGSA